MVYLTSTNFGMHLHNFQFKTFNFARTLVFDEVIEMRLTMPQNHIWKTALKASHVRESLQSPTVTPQRALTLSQVTHGKLLKVLQNYI